MAAAAPTGTTARVEAEAWVKGNDGDIFPAVLKPAAASDEEGTTLELVVTPGDGEPFTVGLTVPAGYEGTTAPSNLVLTCSDDEQDWFGGAIAATVSLKAGTVHAVLDSVRHAFLEEDEDGAVEADEDEDDEDDEEDDDMYGDGGDSDALDDDDEASMAQQAAWVAEHDMFRRLKEQEAESRRLASIQPLPPSARKVQSMFSSKEAGQVLIQELRSLREVQVKHHLVVEPVRFDVYRWDVQLRGFDAKSAIARGLRRLVEQNGYDYVELRFSFAKGLHPFYPPSVQVIRPRLAGSAMWRLMNLAPLQLQNWRPVRPNGMLDVITAVRESLGEWAEVDLDHPSNSLSCESGSYSELERILSTLLTASGVSPRASTAVSAEDAELAARHEAGARAAALAASEEKAKAETSKSTESPKFWAAGTGYSTRGEDSGWDTKAYLAAQAEQDRQLMLALRAFNAYMTPETPGQANGEAAELAAALSEAAASDSHSEDVARASGDWDAGIEKAEAAASSSSAAAAPASADDRPFASGNGSPECRLRFQADANARAARFRKLSARSHEPDVRAAFDEQAEYAEDDAAAGLTVTDTHEMRDRVLRRSPAALAGSCVLPLVADQLQSGTLMGMERRGMLVRSILSVVRGIAGYPELAPTLSLPARSDVEGDGGPSVADIIRRKAMQARAAKGAGVAVEGMYDLLEDVVATASVVDAALKGTDAAAAAMREEEASAAGTAAGAAAASAAGEAAADRGAHEGLGASEAEYCAAMESLQYGYMPSGRIPGFHYASQAASLTKSSRKRMRQVGLEHSILMESMPRSRSSTVFVRYPEARPDTLRVAIVGPEDTPYSGGVFLFDVFFPADYPGKPPVVNLMTTGGGSVRFNPNLYNCGKVCLSLLGTWAGEAGESWDARVSTLNQVLISIQSLIMVPDPYWNEPGYQSRMHTDRGRSEAFLYADLRREATIRFAMTAPIKAPPVGFEEVVQTHFRMRGPALVKQCEDWVAASVAAKSASAAPMAASLAKFKAALATLDA